MDIRKTPNTLHPKDIGPLQDLPLLSLGLQGIARTSASPSWAYSPDPVTLHPGGCRVGGECEGDTPLPNEFCVAKLE